MEFLLLCVHNFLQVLKQRSCWIFGLLRGCERWVFFDQLFDRRWLWGSFLLYFLLRLACSIFLLYHLFEFFYSILIEIPYFFSFFMLTVVLSILASYFMIFLYMVFPVHVINVTQKPYISCTNPLVSVSIAR